jgi:hypothetical protein
LICQDGYQSPRDQEMKVKNSDNMGCGIRHHDIIGLYSTISCGSLSFIKRSNRKPPGRLIGERFEDTMVQIRPQTAAV